MVQLSMPVATQMLLQVAERNIGQLTDIETDVYTGLASPGKRQVSSDATNIGAGSGRATLAAPRYRDASGGENRMFLAAVAAANYRSAHKFSISPWSPTHPISVPRHFMTPTSFTR
jgi:hypothetical protein